MPLEYEPTAEMSVAELAPTLVRELLPANWFGLFTRVQAEPFQCSTKV